MNWSDFWNKPIEISYGGLMVFLFAVSGWYAFGEVSCGTPGGDSNAITRSTRLENHGDET